jgi:hypothetical protein
VPENVSQITPDWVVSACRPTRDRVTPDRSKTGRFLACLTRDGYLGQLPQGGLREEETVRQGSALGRGAILRRCENVPAGMVYGMGDWQPP